MKYEYAKNVHKEKKNVEEGMKNWKTKTMAQKS